MKNIKPCDWIKLKSKTHIALKKYPTCFQVDDEEIVIETNCLEPYIRIKTGNHSFYFKEIEQFVPQHMEYYWFWNKNSKHVKFKKLYSICYDMDVLWKYKTIDCKTYSNCEPFIGKLPSNLKG